MECAFLLNSLVTCYSKQTKITYLFFHSFTPNHTTPGRHSDVHTHQLHHKHTHILRTQPGGQMDTPTTRAWTRGRGHTKICTFTQAPISRVHTRLLFPEVPRARARARAQPSARVWVTAPRPGPLPFPGPRARSSAGPVPRPLTGARRAGLQAGGPARGTADGRSKRWVPHELAAQRPYARAVGSAAAACARPRARSCPSPPRSRAAPCARARCHHAGWGAPHCWLSRPDLSTPPSPSDGE